PVTRLAALAATTSPLLTLLPRPPTPTLFPYTTLFRSPRPRHLRHRPLAQQPRRAARRQGRREVHRARLRDRRGDRRAARREWRGDRKSTRLNSSHLGISYAVFCLKKKTTKTMNNIGTG